MKRFVALALLASLTVLAFADTAEARRCRRRCHSCQQVSQCATGGCQPGYAHAYHDPNMGVQHGSMQPGQPQYAPPAPPQPAQPAQVQPNTTYYRGDASQAMPAAPTYTQPANQVQGRTQFDAQTPTSSSQQQNGNQKLQPDSVNDPTRGDNPAIGNVD